MTNKKNILLVNWGTRDKEYPFKISQKKGLNIFLATSRDYPHWVEKYVPSKQLIFTNTYDSERLLIDVLDFIHKYNVDFDGITTFFEMNIIQTADLAAALGYKFVSPAAARKSSGNKLLMKMVCQKNGIRVPKFFVFKDVDGGFECQKRFSGPTVLKPVKSGHSFGSIKIEWPGRALTKGEFKKKFLKARRHLNSSLDEWMDYWQPYKDDYLIEEYLEGSVVSIDGLVQEKRIMIYGSSEFIMGPEPFFVQEGVLIPASVTRALRKKCFNQTRKIVDILGFNNCGFHCEMKLVNGKIYLLEVAARPPGGDMLEGYELAYDLNPAGLYLDICLGKRVDYEYKKNKNFILQYTIFPRKHNLVVKNIKGFDQVRRMDSYVRGGILTRPGNDVFFQADFFQPILYYFLSSTSSQRLKDDWQQAQISLKIDYSSNFLLFLIAKAKLQIRKFLRNLKRGGEM